MKSFSLFLLVGLLVWCSHTAISGFHVRGPLTTEGFKCLVANNPGANPYSLVLAYKNSAPAGIVPTAVQTLLNSAGAGFRNDLAIELCRGTNATVQVQSLLSVYSSTPGVSYYPGVYLKIIPTTNPSCSWAPYTPASNCAFLTEAVNAVRSIGRTPAVFSTAPNWNIYFGTACNTFATLSNAYLWYANYQVDGTVNPVKSSADFVPFGGWLVTGNKVWVKNVAENVPLGFFCGSGFIDLIYDPLAGFV
jgi:hypothetical protein